jgi:putative ATPase
MTDLFADAATALGSPAAPLAQRIRPRSLDELVGQRHVLGEQSALRLAIEADRPPSMILYGPPGVGKTTLARIVAETTGAAFEELSAVSARVDDVRGVLQRARDRLGANGIRTILFLDEIHRFNKGQQDALLPAVETGLVTLIGATTENPYFEVNAALLSRCAVVELEPLSDEEVAAVVARGGAELGIELSADVVGAIVRKAGGDARSALSTLELASQTAAAEAAPLEARHVADAARKRPLRYDRAGDQHYDIVSAFIKSMRGSDPDAAVYYLAAMLEGGEDARFIARRMVILASEDIGNADPRALLVAVAAAQALEHVGLPEAQLNLSQAAIYLANAPKSNSSARAIWEARSEVRARGIEAPPPGLRDAHYAGAETRGHGVGYVSPHDDPGAAAADHLPAGLAGRTYYVPSGNGEERGDGDGDRDG